MGLSTSSNLYTVRLFPKMWSFAVNIDVLCVLLPYIQFLDQCIADYDGHVTFVITTSLLIVYIQLYLLD